MIGANAMRKSPRNFWFAAIAPFIIISTTFAQPAMVNVGISISDLTADGQTVVGLIYDRPVNEDAVVVYTRGGAVTKIPGAVVGGNEQLHASDDASAFALEMDNIENWGELNCFNSNLEPDDPEPCTYIPAISHHWTANTGWVNCGSFPTNEVVQSYTCGSDAPTDYTVRIGGTRCDFSINSPGDISGDGRYIIGSGWYQTGAPRADGCPPFGFCGNYLPFRWDSTTGNLEMLPVQPGTGTARVDTVNYDGSTLVGYDLGTSPDPDGPLGPIQVYETRRLSVWKDGVQTLLDPYGHIGSPPVNADGTVVVSQSSEALSEVLYGPPMNAEDILYYTRLLRWTWDGANWNPENLGKPALYQGFPAIQMITTSVSADGNTIVGSVGYGAQNFAPALTWRLFICRPDINGGVMTDLQSYLRSQVTPGDTTFDEDKIFLYDVRNLSADGNAMIVTYLKLTDGANCLPTFNNAILYLNGTTCEPPVVEVDQANIVRNVPTPLNSEVINCRATGTWPLTYEWQRGDLSTGQWVDVIDDFDPDCNLDIGQYAYQGATTAQLRIGTDPSFVVPCDAGSGDYRCIVSNSCGSVTTETVHVTIGPDANLGLCFLPGDMNNDFAVNANDIPNFVASILGKPMPDFFPVDRADMNVDGYKNGDDIQGFMEAMAIP